MKPGVPFRNLQDSAAYLAKYAVVAVINDELMAHGFDSLPKFRRARELARWRARMQRAMRREVRHIRARLGEGFSHAT